MSYAKIYKITVKADDENQLPTKDVIEMLLNRIPSNYEYHIDTEEVMECEDCMCADVENNRIYCNFLHMAVSGRGCTWWKKKSENYI